MRQRHDYANLIDFNEDDQEYFGSEPSEDNPVEDIKARAIAHASRHTYKSNRARPKA